MRCFIAAILVFVATMSANAQSAAHAAADSVRTIAVLNLTAENVPREELLRLSTRFRAELRRTGRFRVVKQARVGSAMAELGIQPGECGVAECAKEVARRLGLEQVIIGRVVRSPHPDSANVNTVRASVVDLATGALLTYVEQGTGNEVYVGAHTMRLLAAKLAGTQPRRPIVPVVAHPGGSLVSAKAGGSIMGGLLGGLLGAGVGGGIARGLSDCEKRERECEEAKDGSLCMECMPVSLLGILIGGLTGIVSGAIIGGTIGALSGEDEATQPDAEVRLPGLNGARLTFMPSTPTRLVSTVDGSMIRWVDVLRVRF